MPLKDTQFSDLYLGNDGSWLSGVPGTTDPIAPKPEDQEELLALRGECEKYIKENPTKEDFRIEHAGIHYRASVMATIVEKIFVLRRLDEKVKPLAALGIPAPVIELMMKKRMTGLVVISGAFGQGKTTTAAALVAARIGAYGGVAVTIEDPTEIPLHGRHGDGICYQTEVQQGGFGHACRAVARWAPSIIFIGEIRDPETAIEALRASINGKLVICTSHADNCAMAIERIFNTASAAGASSEDVVGMMATGITAVIHQRLEPGPTRKNLMLEFLFMTDEDATGVRNTIRHKRFDQLKSVIQLQKNRLLSSSARQAN